MTRAEALRRIVSAPREVPDDGRIGHTFKYPPPVRHDVKVVQLAWWLRRYAPDWKKSA